MAYDRFLIAPISQGQVNNSKSWLQPNNAFEMMRNAYCFRQRIRKRFGSQMMGTTPLATRLRMAIGTTDPVTGNLGATNILTKATQIQIGQSFSVGSVIFTVTALGNVNTLSTDLTIVGHINTTVTPNTFSITGNGVTNLNTAVYYYPSLPVMGITQYESGAVNNHPTYAFDTQLAYTFSGGAWDRSGTALWHGNDLNYMWSSNWQGVAGNPVLFNSNFNFTLGAGVPAATDDPIWTFDGTTWVARLGSTANGFFFLPGGGARVASPFIQTSLIILPFKNRLILLNTIENNNSGGAGTGTATQYKQRARYSINGSPFANNAWYEPNQVDAAGAIAAGAGFIDAATQEEIISAEFIKDRLIVGFERSTWELAYTGNELLPFVWQKLNTELGSQSTFSTVPFDKDILTVGQSGLHACNGSNVFRIDEKIPDQVFGFKTENNAAERTCGIRDFFTEMVYWAYVSDDAITTQKFPEQVLVYNYALKSWAVNDDCFTTFGYFEQQNDLTWASSAPVTWQQFNGTWTSNVSQANQRQILGGTPEGFIIKLNVEETRNAPALSITNMTFAATGLVTLTMMDHNLSAVFTNNDYDDDFILIENVVGDAPTMTAFNGNIFIVYDVIDKDTVRVQGFDPIVSGAYYGAGTAARVSNVQLTTKNFNPYVDQGVGVFVAKADFAVQKTGSIVDGVVVGGGEITVDYTTSMSPLGMLGQSVQSGSALGDSILETRPYNPNLYPFEQSQRLLWHQIYFQAGGDFLQMNMYFDRIQMQTPNISLVPFEIEAITIHTQPLGRIQS